MLAFVYVDLLRNLDIFRCFDVSDMPCGLDDELSIYRL